MEYERARVEPLCDVQMDAINGGGLVLTVVAAFDMWLVAVQGVAVVWGVFFW